MYIHIYIYIYIYIHIHLHIYIYIYIARGPLISRRPAVDGPPFVANEIGTPNPN